MAGGGKIWELRLLLTPMILFSLCQHLVRMVLPFYLSRFEHNPLGESSGWRADPCLEKGFDVWIFRNMRHLGGSIVCVSSASWRQLDGLLWVGKAVGEEKKGICMVRGGKAVLCLEEETEAGWMPGAGWRTIGIQWGIWRWVHPVSQKLQQCPRNCMWSPKDKPRAEVCAACEREGSSSRQCSQRIKAAGSFCPGDKPWLGIKKLAQTETGTATA